jgi:hypothetical protein
MKIRKITATPINLRLEAPYLWVFGELDSKHDDPQEPGTYRRVPLS